MIQNFLSISSFKTFVQELIEARHAFVPSLWEMPIALITLALRKTLEKPLLIITGRERGDKLALDIETLAHFSPLEYPAWETLPEEEISPSLDIVGRRFDILAALDKPTSPPLILAPLQAVLQKVPSQETLASFFLNWHTGQTLPFDTIPSTLERLGYTRRSVVTDKGEFAVRGGIVDLFAVSDPFPCRLDFFGDTLEEIRIFDPTSQKSTSKKHSLFIAPTHEHLLLKTGKKVAFFDFLPEGSLLFFDDLALLEDHYVALKALPSFHTATMLTVDALIALTRNYRTLFGTSQPLTTLSEELTYKEGKAHLPIFGNTLIAKEVRHPFQKTDTLFPQLAQIRHLTFFTASDAETKAVQEKLPPGLSNVQFASGYLSSGVYIPEQNTAWIPYAEISGRHKIHRQKWREVSHTPAAEFHELSPGDFVVHLHTGIGKFLGIEKQKSHDGTLTEFFVIQYASQGKLYVPLSQSHLISRYIGATEEAPTLHTIGENRWQRTKANAQQAIIGYAKELLTAQASRELSGGFMHPPDPKEMLLFEEEFPFIETEDQLKAIAAIKQDMESAKAMDRLICGDVGYGKTEVAMRAAFKTVAGAGKQVAVLVPTTTLAIQHGDTFRERMANFPCEIRVLSRFQSRSEVADTLKAISTGRVDIVIGTHRMISKDVHFNNLGLVIIDEEQRFGVRAKEHLKKFAHGVDCLTLSATPIPRTLYLALVNARDLSVINTPPQDRLPIKTIVAEKDPELIKNACLRELAREGQVFFIHNRVETIYKVKEELAALLPQARIQVGHGQMEEGALDEIFHAFKQGTVDILVATTIVENGIDIPNANTLFIDRADTFGLADLYQLRGRVGRWNRPAYAYLLTPKNREISEISQKRLHALLSTSGFGGGLKLAMRDLEIRGAGDILGVRQSGQVSSIGFHLYCKLLKKTIEALKKKKTVSFLETKMEFPFDCALPETYIPETSLRLEIYHRLGEANTHSEIDALRAELIDRFGPLPDPALLLLHMTRLRIAASEKGYTLLKYNRQILTTERQGERQTHVLPFFKTPEEFEKIVVERI